MPKQITSMFTRYDFSEQEIKQAQQLPELLTMYLENLRAEIAERKVALTYDPANPLRFTQAEAEHQGQILLLTALLDESRNAKQEALQEAIDASEGVSSQQ